MVRDGTRKKKAIPQLKLTAHHGCCQCTISLDLEKTPGEVNLGATHAILTIPVLARYTVL